MITCTVTNQTELNQALTEARGHPDDHYKIIIQSPRGVRLSVSDTGSSTVEAYGRSTVRASGSSTVEAYDYSTVEAYDYSIVQTHGNSTVEAYGSSTVRASGSSTVEAYGRSTVRAFGDSTVRAFGSSTVRAFGNSTVRAGSHTAVHLHSGYCSVTGGVLIDHTAVDLTDTAVWAGYHGCTIDDSHLIAYKAVRDDYRSQRGTEYRPGTTASCDAFTDTDRCGGGLHFSPTPAQARDYDRDATRFIELRVPVAAVRTITDGGTPKAKAASVTCVREVDIHGRPIGAE